jgi:signal transduction histidine kinase
LPGAALLIGDDDRLLAVNDEAHPLFVPPSTRPSHRFRDLPLSYEVAGLRSAVDGVRSSGARVTIADVAWPTTTGDVHLDIDVCPVHGADGMVGAVLLVATDRSELLAERSRHEELRAEHAELRARQEASHAELLTMNEELEASNEQLRHQVRQLAEAEEADIRKNHFLAMLAHELRNPLGAAVNALHVIHEAAGDDRRIHQAVRIAQRQLGHEARLLDDLLDVSRIILGKISVERHPVDLGASVRAAVEGVDHAARSLALQVRVNLADEPLVAIGDATRIEQCLGNLLSNAMKFTAPGGTVTIGARRDGEHVVVVVSDSGVGIAPEMLPRVFDLFTQADPSLARAQGGLGIGLTLVRHLVELQGGTIAARSDGLGRGSEFEIRLRLSDRAPAAPGDAAPGAVRPRRILIVEDNRDAREILRTVLEMSGHSVLDASDGAAAIRMAGESAPDVVVLDIGLPDVDGFEVARRIRARLGAKVRLIGVSGYGDDDARRAGRDAGFDAHLVKPVAPEALLRSLGTLT